MQARIEVIGGAMDGKVYTISSTAQIGRDEQNEIAISTDKHISRRHARLATGEEGFLLEDLGSTNGTYIDEQLVKAPVLLTHEQLFRVGRTTFRITYQ